MYDFVARNGSSASLGSASDQTPSLGSASEYLPNGSGQHAADNQSNGHASNGHTSNGHHTVNGHAASEQSIKAQSVNGQPTKGQQPVNGQLVNGNAQNVEQNQPTPSPNGKATVSGFTNPYAACNFIVTWDGEDVRAVFEAIKVARSSGDRFIQDKLIEYILNIPFRNPRPDDIPAFVGKPIWAVDKQGLALVGMPGAEMIVSVDSLRTQLKSGKPVI